MDLGVISCQNPDLAELKTACGDRISLMGNVDFVGVMCGGTPEQVERECMKCTKEAGEGGGFFLSGDCELPPETPAENMKAMERAGRNFGAYPLSF
jgi:uroporphyrinogen decarboxylase